MQGGFSDPPFFMAAYKVDCSDTLAEAGQADLRNSDEATARASRSAA